jgi:hypothetical protein
MLHTRIGSTSEGSSFFGLFTRWLNVHIFIWSAGSGLEQFLQIAVLDLTQPFRVML